MEGFGGVWGFAVDRWDWGGDDSGIWDGGGGGVFGGVVCGVLAFRGLGEISRREQSACGIAHRAFISDRIYPGEMRSAVLTEFHRAQQDSQDGFLVCIFNFHLPATLSLARRAGKKLKIPNSLREGKRRRKRK